MRDLEYTQPLPFGGATRAARQGYTGVSHPPRLDAAGHTLCDLTRSDLAELLVLVRLQRCQLLAERRTYVSARQGDLDRFTELLRTLDTQINAQNTLADKLARLIVEST